jgi:hypothetical protein
VIFPRVMFDGFLRHYSEIEVVNVERELKLVGEYFVSLMETKMTSDQFYSQQHSDS